MRSVRKKRAKGTMVCVYILAFIVASLAAQGVIQVTGWGQAKTAGVTTNEVSGYEYTPVANIQGNILTSFSLTNKRGENCVMYYEIVNNDYNAVIYRSDLIPFESTNNGGKLLAVPEEDTSVLTLKVYAIDTTTKKELSQSDVTITLNKEKSA